MSSSSDLSAFKGKSLLVTGGASGIGLAISTRFARAGAHVTIADVQHEAGTAAALDLVSQGLVASFEHCDVQDFATCVGAFENAACRSPSGSIDIVVLAAGVLGEQGSLVEQVVRARAENKDKDKGTGVAEPRPRPRPPPHRALDVNLLGLYESVYTALWYMSVEVERDGKERERAGGTKSLILISSMAAYTDAALFSDYQASKFGVRGLFRGLRHTTLTLNIRLNVLAPSFVRTPLMEPALPTFAAAGVVPGQGITFVDVERVVDAAERFAVDESLHGRAWAVVPAGLGEGEGIVDLKDDEDGTWAAETIKRIVERGRAAGDAY